MKKNVFIVSILAINLFLFSCKDKKEESELEYPYTDVETSKTQLETNGTQLVTELSTFKDEKGIDALKSFSDLNSVEALPIESAAANNMVFAKILNLNSVTSDPQADEIFGVLKSSTTQTTTISDQWNAMKGIYTWNSTKKSWDVTASSTVFEVNYPTVKGGTSNNAKFTITSYKGSAVYDLAEKSDLPVEINANLKIDGTEYFTYSFAGAYTTEGVPTSIVTSFGFRTFVFAYSLTNNNSEVGVNYSFKNGETIILDLGTSAKGDFAVDNVITNIDTIEHILHTADAHVQLFNVKVTGNVDIVKLAKAQKDLYANEKLSTFDRVKADTLMVTEINKDAKLVAIFTDTKNKIADVVAYAKIGSKTVYVNNVAKIVKTSELNFKFKFADNSSIDTFIKTGFDSLSADADKLVKDINTKFGIDVLSDLPF
jgi:hypothetical protein